MSLPEGDSNPQPYHFPAPEGKEYPERHGSHTRSASYFSITCAIHQRKDNKGHWYFVQSKKVSQRKFNENTILCFYISIFYPLYYSLGQHFQLSSRASDCATKTCNKDSMWSTEI